MNGVGVCGDFETLPLRGLDQESIFHIKHSGDALELNKNIFDNIQVSHYLFAMSYQTKAWNETLYNMCPVQDFTEETNRTTGCVEINS